MTPLRILLADDAPVVGQSGKNLLEAEGFEGVGEAVDGEEATRLAEALNPDVVILDLAMHGLNGLYAARGIHQACPRIHMILLASTRWRRSGFESGRFSHGDGAGLGRAWRARMLQVAYALDQTDVARIASQEFEPPVRGEILPDEFSPQIALDHPSQARYAQAHQRSLLCAGSDVGAFSLKTAQEASLLHVDRCFTQHLFSD